MALGYFVMLPDDYENLSESVIASNSFANNFLSAITTRNYWDVTNEFKPLMHTWYVGVLMQFYLIYPLLFYLAKLDKNNSKGTLLTMIATLGVFSLLAYFGTEDAAKRFYYLPSRFFEFAVGGIVALTNNPKEEKPFGKVFVYASYSLLLFLMAINAELIPSNIRLVMVVALAAVLLCSQDILENRLSGNTFLATIGAASYSIFIWHQIVLAFCRYCITCNFSALVLASLLLVTTFLSWLSYSYIEQTIIKVIKTKGGRYVSYFSTIILFLALNAFAAYIYLNAGVVRDVPELYVSMQNKHRGMHAEYVDRGNQYNKPFKTDKKHWYVIGNSFGRDFVNIILESPVADSVEVSYSTDLNFRNESSRFSQADIIFISTLGLKEEFVTEVEILCLANGFQPSQLVVVGEKNFGVSNGQVYAKRGDTDYFEQFVDVENKERFIERNKYFAKLYGNRFLDLMSMVTNEKDQVKVFSPDHHFISADCRHLSKGGAIMFSQMIDWNKFIE